MNALSSDSQTTASRTSVLQSEDPLHTPVPRAVLVAYAAPALSSSFLFTAVSLYLLKFSTDILLMAPATMGSCSGSRVSGMP